MADEVLKHFPNFAYAMVKKGTAAYYLMKTKYMDKYQTIQDIPKDQRPYLAYLQRINQSTFDKADSLGRKALKR